MHQRVLIRNRAAGGRRLEQTPEALGRSFAVIKVHLLLANESSFFQGVTEPGFEIISGKIALYKASPSRKGSFL